MSRGEGAWPGLGSRTSPAWARRVLERPLALLDDHAHLEKKAATNALDLMNRSAALTRPMAAVARDEIEHLGLVLRLLERRGGRMSRAHANPYACALRRLVRRGSGPDELLDRILVSALIEARSCERFSALGAACDDPELRRLYRGLEGSERGHHRVFLALAEETAGDAALRRWRHLLAAEARILSSQPPGPGMHSGDPA